MAKATDKHPAIDAPLSSMMGKDRRSTIEQDMCMTCNGEAKEFRNDLSRREYTISGMCQKCQDETFGVD